MLTAAEPEFVLSFASQASIYRLNTTGKSEVRKAAEVFVDDMGALFTKEEGTIWGALSGLSDAQIMFRQLLYVVSYLYEKYA